MESGQELADTDAVDPGTIGEDSFAVIAAELCGLALLFQVWRREMTGQGTVLLVQSLAPSTVR